MASSIEVIQFQPTTLKDNLMWCYGIGFNSCLSEMDSPFSDGRQQTDSEISLWMSQSTELFPFSSALNLYALYVIVFFAMLLVKGWGYSDLTTADQNLYTLVPNRSCEWWCTRTVQHEASAESRCETQLSLSSAGDGLLRQERTAVFRVWYKLQYLTPDLSQGYCAPVAD